MNKLFITCLLLTTAFTVKAQDMSFEETVKYINDKMINCKTRYSRNANEYSTVCTKLVQIKNTGEVIISFNMDNLYSPIKFNIQNILKIGLSDTHGTGFIKFYTSDVGFYVIKAESQIESERLIKAFNHLKTVCTKSKDPFDN